MRLLLGNTYDIERDVINCNKQGWRINRLRQYVVGRHKGLKMRIGYNLNSKQLLVDCFERGCCYRFDCYLTSTTEELQSERQWACNRPKVKARHMLENPIGLEYAHDAVTSYEYCLTCGERERLDQFLQSHPDFAWDLGQSSQRMLKSKLDGNLHTLIKGAGLLWVPSLQPPRWMTAPECFTAMGWPISNEHVQLLNVTCPFTRGSTGYPGRSRSSQIAQIGNSMHVNSIGAVMMLIMCEKSERGMGVAGLANIAYLPKNMVESSDIDDSDDTLVLGAKNKNLKASTIESTPVSAVPCPATMLRSSSCSTASMNALLKARGLKRRLRH